MSRQTIFTAGSLAKAYVEVSDWYGEHTEAVNAKKICVPFSGFGRLASAMCQTDTSMYCCDFQHLHTAIIKGVFGAREWKSNVDKPRFSKGLAVEGKLIRNIDVYSAGFIDWVAKNGTDLDVAAIGMSIPGQTMRGWLSTWTGNFDKLWEKFNRVREEFRPFINMPGSWCWIEDDIFKAANRFGEDDGLMTIPKRFDVIAVDPPRLGTGPNGKDAYSLGAWPKLNAVLLQGYDYPPVKIKPWTTHNYHGMIHSLFERIDSDYILFSWTEGNPPTEMVRTFVCAHGKIIDETIWESHNKTIYGWWIRRH